MTKEAKNIIDFWNSVEKFTPCQIETDNNKKPFLVENIQREVLANYDLPWINKDRFKHFPNEGKSWVYTIFLGIIALEDITTQMKELLHSDYPDYDLRKTKGVSCIASFKINIEGFLVENSLSIPDYFLSMGALALKEKYPDEWLNYRKIIERSIKDVFDNLCDELNSSNNKKIVEYDHINHLLRSFVACAGWSSFLDKHLSKNTAVIYSSKVPILKSQDENLAVSDNEESAIINSFFIEDLTKISSEIEKNPDKINKSLKQYLNIKTKDQEFDLCKDQNLIKEFSNFRYLPKARWPGKGGFPLVLSQQIAVNLSLKEEEGLFSVNGPPGTGKTTLLRDIISGVILKRAKVLSGLDNPADAFINPNGFQINQYNYKSWQLIPELLGHEIFIASSNNNAVENISKEIPLLDQVDDAWKIDYFSEISSFILEKPSWGLGSAALGSSKNKNQFFSKFWDKKPQQSSDKFYGLEYLLNETNPDFDWPECRKEFLKSLSDYEKLEAKLVQLEKSLKLILDLQNQNLELEKQINELQKDNEKLSKQFADLSKIKDELVDNFNLKKDSIKFHKEAKPTFIEIIIEIFSKFENYKKWRKQYSKLLEEFDYLNKEIEGNNKQISYSKNQISNITEQINQSQKTLASNHEQINEKLILVNECKLLMGNNFPGEEFWQLPDEELQLKLPWNFKELHHLRAEIFVKALNLHKAFIIGARKPLMNNLRIMKRKMAGDLPEEYGAIVPHIWATFFCVVPTVSTTFASFTNLCRELNSNSIGYLLIDEAGQAIPQAAAGAIYRSKRAIIVGDPMQIKPVITIPKAMVDALKNYHQIENDLFNPLEQSVQTLADRANNFGTFIGKDENRKWVGCPLRVHRRCNDPMFKIANNIAYDNLMISATKNKPSKIENIFPQSLWIDISAGQTDSNWIIEEGEAVRQILSKIIKNDNKLPSLYIISPFKVVASNMKKLLFSKANNLFGFDFGKDEISEWIKKSVGTIHTFQGKEAEVVILLLGGNPKKPGSLDWAAKEPNILNVGLTRAKNLVLVVGNYNSWSKKKYFQELSFEISKIQNINSHL